ncbi:MAG: DUF21 domain-containing protein [Proteobacteria bacterium]|nr:DUF21 domain-containing protein [Pseudomonadota bacterium]
MILVALGLIALNGFLVLMEFALVRVRSSRLEILVRQGSPRAAMVQEMLQHLDLYLSAIQMGITMTSLGLGWVGEPAMARYVENWLGALHLPYSHAILHGISFVLAFGVITFLHILFGEMVPRFIGLQHSERISLLGAIPLRFLYLALKAPAMGMAEATRFVLRIIQLGAVSESEGHMSEEEIRILLGSSEEKGRFSLERLMLIENIFDFGSAKASDAMMPRDKVAFLSLAKPWEENLAVIRSRRYSRYPLCKEGLDTTLGFVHVKDLVLNTDANWAKPDLGTLRRDITTVAPGDSIQKLLQTFADKGTHMALVREGTGPVSGLLTVEDIVEEIVGEIHDEFDMPQAWSLMEVLVPGGAEVGIEAQSAQDIIWRLLNRIKAAHHSLDLAAAAKQIIERESKFSTAVGHGLAIPHARLPNLDKPLMAIGRSPRGLPFPAPDKTPVRLVFLVLSPAGAPLIQLKILARIASLVSNDNLRRRLLRARTAEHLVEILKTADTVVSA